MDTKHLTELIKKCDKFIKSEDNYSEEDIKTNLIEPLFEDILGWNIRYRKGHGSVKEQKNQPSGKPDYIFYDDDDRVTFFLEAKKLKNITESDIKQAFNYAFSQSKRWSILTNFKQLYILVCDNKASSLQDHIYKRLNYSDFNGKEQELLSLLSYQSFTKGELDKLAIEDGRLKEHISIDDELLEDIKLWRKRLTENIKKNHPNVYIKQDLDEIVQTILDRIMFIRAVEDRKKEAIRDETLKALLNQYDNDHKINIKQQLNHYFKTYDSVYDSKLFTFNENDTNQRHQAERVDIDNDILYRILKGTYEKGETIEYNFKDIPADVLGTIYENYLGYIQERRKEQGIYYTPPYIVDYIVRNSLLHYKNQVKSDKLNRIKILDMACGSGSFLIKAFDYLNEHFKEVEPNSYKQKRISIDERESKFREDLILEENLYGVDIDAKACDITKLNLLLKGMEAEAVPPHKLPNLYNVRVGNSIFPQETLIDAEQMVDIYKSEKIKPDIIISNPPYNATLTDTDKKLAKMLYSGFNSGDTAEYFFKKGLDLLHEGGIIGFIIPKSLAYYESWSGIRNYLLNETTIHNIADVGLAFNDVRLEEIIIVATKRRPKRNYKIMVERFSDLKRPKKVKNVMLRHEIESRIMRNNNILVFAPLSAEEQNILEVIDGRSIKFETLIKDSCRGLFITDKNKERIKKGKTKLIIKEPTIQRYFVENYIEVDTSSDFFDRVKLQRISVPKLIFKVLRGKRLNVVFDNDGSLITTGNVVNAIIDASKEYEYEFLLGLFNSSLISFYIQKSLFSDTTESARHIDRPYLNLFPVPTLKYMSKRQYNEVKVYANKLSLLYYKANKLNSNLEEKQHILREIESYEEKIDELVYKIYRLSDKSIDLVKAYFKRAL